MPRFFAAADVVHGERVLLDGDLAHHLVRVLRARKGERISLVSAAIEYGVELDVIDPQRLEGAVIWSRPATGEPRLRVHVLQALPKDGMDEAIDALVQAGAASIRPMVTARTVSRPDPGRAAARGPRWQAVAATAAGIAFRALVPEVHVVQPMHVALAGLPLHTRILMCDFEQSQALPLAGLVIDATRPLALCIGPEGGWDVRDRETTRTLGAEPVHLGARVFRTRLAGALGVTLALAASGDLDAPGSPAPV